MIQGGTEKALREYCISKQYSLERGFAQGIAHGISSENGHVRLGMENYLSIAIIEELSVGEVAIPNPTHYARVEPREPLASRSEGALPILGVFYGNRFVDGYHRLKWAKNQGLSSGFFIILY